MTTDYTDDTDAEALFCFPVKSLLKASLTLLVLASFVAPALRAQREKLPPEDLEFVEKNWPEAKKTSTGIRYLILQEGHGEMPKAGQKIEVLYVGRLLNGTVFDQTADREHPFPFRVGRQMVIDGWDQTLPLMKLGEKRLMIIPPELAYGTRGQPPKIPRNATLVFEVELIDIKHD